MKVKVPPCTIGSRHPKVLWSKINIIIMTKMTTMTMTMIDHNDKDYEDDGIEANKKNDHIHHQPAER